MKQTARSISLSYLPAEDRIRLAGRCEDGACVAVWVTRRHLAILLPRLAEWLDRQSPLQRRAAAPPAARREIRQFEHQAAQERASSERRRERQWTADSQFLLNNFAANQHGRESFEIVLAAPGDEQLLTLPMNAAQLHKFVREVLEIGKAAGWGLPDPWQAPPSSGTTAKH